MAQQLLEPQPTHSIAAQQQQPDDAPDLGSLTFQIRGGGRPPSAKMALLRVAAGVAAGELASQ